MTRLAQGAPASVREILLRRRKTTCINHHVSVPRLEFQESSCYSSGAAQTVARKAGRALSAERVTSYFKNSKLTKTTTVESGGA